MNRKRIGFIAVLVLGSAFALCSCRHSEPAVSAETDAELPELKIGVDMLTPFFYVDDNGDYRGIDADIAAEACRRANYAPDFIEVKWSDRDDYLQDGRIDCLWSAFIKNGREDSYHWTETYMKSNLRVITDIKSPDKDLGTISGHGGMAVRAGSRLEDILLNDTEDLPEIQIYSCGTFEMAETAFVKGFASSLGGHEIVLQQVISNYPDLYHFLDGSILAADLGVAFRKNDTSEHYEKINQAIHEMNEDGTIEKILEEYGVNASSAEEVSAND